MPASLRRQLADVFEASASGTDGMPGSATVTRQRSEEAHGSYWVLRGVPSARERQVAAQQQQELDTVFEFGWEARSVLSPNRLIRYDGKWYSITGVEENEPMREITVKAVHASDEPEPATIVE